MGGHKCGSICLMHRNIQRSNSGQSRSRASMMPEDYVVFSSLIPTNFNFISTGKPLGTVGQHKTKYECIVEADESVRIRTEGSLRKNHEDHIAGKCVNSSSHYNLVHTFFQCLKPWKYQMQRQQWINNWESWRNERHGSWRKSGTRRKVIDEGRNEGRKVHFASFMDLCYLKNRSRNHNFKNTKVESYSEVILSKTIQVHTQYLLNKDHQLHKWPWTVFQGYQVVQDKQQTQCLFNPGQSGRCTIFFFFWWSQNHSVQTLGFVYHDTNGFKSCLIQNNQNQTFFRGPMILKVMRRYAWRHCELANISTQQLHKSRNSMYWRPSSQRRRDRICWRSVKILLTYCSEMFAFGSNWQTWYFIVSGKSCPCHDKADESARLISYIHDTSEFKQYCHVGNTARQCRLGLFQDSDFAGDIEDSISTSGGILCIFWKSHVRANKLYLQETDFSFS